MIQGKILLVHKEGKEKPPKPPPLECRHCGKPGRVFYSKRTAAKYKHWASDSIGYWTRNRSCYKCYSSLQQHGMTGPQVEEFLSRGCAIPECSKPARYVDHDHLIHPASNHSCDSCRRGPLCANHNRNVMYTLDALRSGASHVESEWEYANRLHSVSVNLAGEEF